MGVQFIFFVVEAESNSSSSPVQALGPVCLKLVTQDVSGLCFRRSTYGWKANPSGLTSKAVQNQWESWSQVSAQNLPGCCDTVIWSVGPCIMFGPIRGRVQGVTSKILHYAIVTLIRVGFCCVLVFHMKQTSCAATISPRSFAVEPRPYS